jgi:hypothetical protein
MHDAPAIELTLSRKLRGSGRCGSRCVVWGVMAPLNGGNVLWLVCGQFTAHNTWIALLSIR